MRMGRGWEEGGKGMGRGWDEDGERMGREWEEAGKRMGREQRDRFEMILRGDNRQAQAPAPHTTVCHDKWGAVLVTLDTDLL